VDDEKRQTVLFLLTNIIMGLVSAGMTVVNIFTQKYLLMASTLLFAVACALNIFFSKREIFPRVVTRHAFVVEILVLCIFFCVSGTPEGFSALWFCFIPSFGFVLFGWKRGMVLAGAGMAAIVFLFWTPVGRSLLQYDYTASFMLRFPMLYTAFCAMSIFVEMIRVETQRQFVLAEQKYMYLYKHDALTGVFNRYGFNERLDAAFASGSHEHLSLMILDIDFFKRVNDTYGHDVGDVVLRFVADTLRAVAGEYGDISRWGGEEFTVLLDGSYDGPAVAEQIRRRIEESEIQAKGFRVQVTVSIGVCTVEERSDVTVAQLVTRTDRCLYVAKESGRNRVECAIL